jgi:hypothetical protein
LKTWEQHLEEYIAFLREFSISNEGNLRFGQKAVAASDIAEQFYCEKKIEMQHIYGEIETEAKTIGTIAHEKLLEGTVLVKTEDMWKRIYAETPVLARETPLLAQHKDIVVVGGLCFAYLT